MLEKQRIIFDIKYVPYSLPKNATDKQRAEHEERRRFYSMDTGGNNVFDYINTEGKRVGDFSALDYLQKNTGVFNGNGMIPDEEVKEMKKRLRENTGMIWSGFISFNEEDSVKINTPEKCVNLVKRTFGQFFDEAHLGRNKIDLMCALHTDKPKHYHIHFVFWEKEPTLKEADGTLGYRKKGKINETAIDNMFVRLGLFVSEENKNVYESRDDALTELKKMTAFKSGFADKEEICDAVIELAKDLPKTGRLGYGSKEMEPFRERVDRIVRMMLNFDKDARDADRRFHAAVQDKKREIEEICKGNMRTQRKNYTSEHVTIIEDLEKDYKRRQGNLIINLARAIKPEYYERTKARKYETNDKQLKKRLTLSRRKVGRLLDGFFRSFSQRHQLFERDFSQRLQEIEKEIEEKRKEENAKTEQKEKEERYKN